MFWCRKYVIGRTFRQFLMSRRCRNDVVMALSTIFDVEMMTKLNCSNWTFCRASVEMLSKWPARHFLMSKIELCYNFSMSRRCRNNVERTCSTCFDDEMMSKFELYGTFLMSSRCFNDVKMACSTLYPLSKWCRKSNDVQTSHTFLNLVTSLKQNPVTNKSFRFTKAVISKCS